VAATVFIGLGVSSWMFVKEKAARQRADTEAKKSQLVADFLKDMLNGVGPSVARGRDTVMLKEILEKTADRVGKDLEGEPAVEAEMRNTIGKVYNDLGELEKAESMDRRALAIREKLFGSEHPDVAESLHNLADVLANRGDLAEAEKLHRQALEM